MQQEIPKRSTRVLNDDDRVFLLRRGAIWGVMATLPMPALGILVAALNAAPQMLPLVALFSAPALLAGIMTGLLFGSWALRAVARGYSNARVLLTSLLVVIGVILLVLAIITAVIFGRDLSLFAIAGLVLFGSLYALPSVVLMMLGAWLTLRKLDSRLRVREPLTNDPLLVGLA